MSFIHKWNVYKFWFVQKSIKNTIGFVSLRHMSVPTTLSFFHNDLWAPPFFREKSIIHHCTSPLFWFTPSLSDIPIATISFLVSPARGSFSQSPLDGWSFFLCRVQSSRHYSPLALSASCFYLSRSHVPFLSFCVSLIFC